MPHKWRFFWGNYFPDFQPNQNKKLGWSVSKQHLPLRKSKSNRYTIIAIPYNPYEPNPYSRWTIDGLLNIENELKVVEEFWDFLGKKYIMIYLLVLNELKSRCEKKLLIILNNLLTTICFPF